MKYLSLIISIIALGAAGFIWWQSSQSPAPLYISAEPVDLGEVPESFLNARTLDIPEQLSFAGETVPLDIPDVRERLDRELHVNTYWHNNTIFLIKRANRWLPQMEPILEEYGIPDDFKYVTVIESNLMNEISPAGAVGFWQFMKPTAKEFGLVVARDVDERYHPLKATEAAAKYLKKSYEKFGNWTLVAASYNRGMAGVERALNKQNVSNYYDMFLNSETSRYMFRILAIKEIIENQEKYGFEIGQEHLYEPEALRYVEVNETIPDLVAWSKEQGINYKLLKRHNPWLRDDKLRLRDGESFEIGIPTEVITEY